MTPDLPEQLTGAGAGRVREVVRAALGEPTAVLGAWEVAPMKGGFGALAGRSSVYGLAGVARVGADERAWRLALKVCVPLPDQDDPTHIHYWRREPMLYAAGQLADLPAGLRAPRCYGHDELADGTFWLWLEHVGEAGPRTWPLARWAVAARHLGQLNGAYLAAEPGRPALPRAPWLGGRRLRTWLERHAQLVPLIAAAPDDPELRGWWPRPVVDAILRLWAERDELCAALERLPQTFCHGDAIRRNLYAVGGADGAEQTVGIDWEYAGYYAAGEEVGQTLSVAAAFFDLDPAELPALDEALFAGYLAGLREAGWRGDERPVRFAYAAHAALRNLFNAVGARRVDEARRPAILQSQGRSWEELAGARAAVRPFLLERADEARRLLAAP
jgi:hypothetical protein